MDQPLVRPRALADPPAAETFPAISDYGIVGNLETVALIASSGAVEFFCYPEFDSPSLFAAMLDRRAGAFTVGLDVADTGTQRYLEGTNVLVTRFERDGRVADVTDFMPVGGEDVSNQLVRIVTAVSGTVQVTARCRPSFNYGRGKTTPRRKSDGCVVFEDGGVADPVRLVADRPVAFDESVATVEASLAEGERLVLVMVADGDPNDLLSRGLVDEALEATTAWWRDWLAQSTYDGEFRAAVLRSALALKLMFSDAHGSIVAAPTMSLPEAIGGDRNWDYRYCWLRDSAFTIYAMLQIGFTREAEKYRSFVRDRVEERGDGTLRLMYRLDGTEEGLEEEVLDHLTGYRNSRPVRLGNAAAKQTQRDIYGEVIDAHYLAHGNLGPISDRAFHNLSLVVETICTTWDQPGNGFWEMRGEPQLFLDALLMSWVGVDRALRICAGTGRPAGARWREACRAISDTIETGFFNERIGAYTQIKGGERVDAVALLLPLMRYTRATCPRFRSTLGVIEERLVDGPCVRRYERPPERIEGLDGAPEGHFVACSFWYIEVLARSERLDEARRRFREMLAFASPLGLFSEEIARDGTHLGNTPQALSHLSLISAAVAMSRVEAQGGAPF